jgi:hypothetical protein
MRRLDPSRAARALTLAVLLFEADLALAQFDQYTEPGGPRDRPRSRQEQLEGAMESAPWRFGVVRLKPWISLSDIQYVDNALAMGDEEEKVSDVTATLGAGLRAYLRTGPKLIWAAHVLPEYVGWQELDERNSVNGRYGLGAFGLFNRMTLEALVERDQEQRFASPEIPEQAHLRSERGRLAAEVRVSGHMSVFGSAQVGRVRHLVDDPAEAPLDLLNRDTTYLRAGLRWHLPRGWSLGLGAERSQADFEQDGIDYSNAGTAPVVEVRWDRGEEYLRFEAAQRELEPRGDSRFVPFDETTANLEVGFNTEGRIPLWTYGGRGLAYSFSGDWAYLTEDRLGITAGPKLGWRTGLRLFGELGRHDYTAAAAGVPERDDDATAYGAALVFAFGKTTSLTVSARRFDVDSNLAGFDRSVTSLGLGLAFGGQRDDW